MVAEADDANLGFPPGGYLAGEIFEVRGREADDGIVVGEIGGGGGGGRQCSGRSMEKKSPRMNTLWKPMTMWWIWGEDPEDHQHHQRGENGISLLPPPNLTRAAQGKPAARVGGMPWYFFSGVRGLVKPPLCGDPLPTL